MLTMRWWKMLGVVTVLAVTRPVRASPQINAEFAIGAVGTPGSNPQFRPAAAFNGTNWLVVWEDHRTGSEGVYGARVSASGAVLDPGFRISTTPGMPAVAHNGTNWLVVWDSLSGGFLRTFGARVSPSGSVLDATPIAIQTSSGDRQEPTVAKFGSKWLVVYQYCNGGCDIRYTTVRDDGTLVPGEVTVNDASSDQIHPQVARLNDTTDLVVWEDYRNGGEPDIYGSRLHDSGAGLMPDSTDGFPISTAADYQLNPKVASDGAGWLVVWEDFRNGGILDTDHADVYGARVHNTALGFTVDDTDGIPISTAPHAQGAPSVAYDGTNWLAVWADFSIAGNTKVVGANLSSTGTVLDAGGFQIATGLGSILQAGPVVVPSSSKPLLVVYETGNSTSHVKARTVGAPTAVPALPPYGPALLASGLIVLGTVRLRSKRETRSSADG